MTDRIANKDVRPYVESCRLFRTNNETIIPKQHDRCYVVYSYGEHFPMYCYIPAVDAWVGNDDGYSATTSRHKNLARPRAPILWTDLDTLRALIDKLAYGKEPAEEIYTDLCTNGAVLRKTA